MTMLQGVLTARRGQRGEVAGHLHAVALRDLAQSRELLLVRQQVQLLVLPVIHSSPVRSADANLKFGRLAV